MKTYTKDPAAVLDYGRDWTAWLAPTESIVTSTWTLDPANADTALTLSNSTGHTAKATVVWAAGGTVGVTYRIINRITTDGGRTDERTDEITVQQR